MTKDHGPSIRDDKAYDALRKDDVSNQKAARVTNAHASSDQSPPQKGGEAELSKKWTVDELIAALRDH